MFSVFLHIVCFPRLFCSLNVGRVFGHGCGCFGGNGNGELGCGEIAVCLMLYLIHRHAHVALLDAKIRHHDEHDSREDGVDDANRIDWFLDGLSGGHG